MTSPTGAPGTNISEAFDGSLHGLGQWGPHSEAHLLQGAGWAGNNLNQVAVHQPVQQVQHIVPGQLQQGLIGYTYPSYAFINLGYQMCQPTAEDAATHQTHTAWQHQEHQLSQGLGANWFGWSQAGTTFGGNWAQGCYPTTPVIQTQIPGIPVNAAVTNDACSFPVAVPGEECPGLNVNVDVHASINQGPVGGAGQDCNVSSDWLARLNPPECSPWESRKDTCLDPVERNASVRRWQDWLRFLQHCATCSAAGMCAVGEACAAGKELWRHMLVCTDKECKVRSCRRTRAVWQHQAGCGSALCDLCAPAHVGQGAQSMSLRPLSSLALLNQPHDTSVYKPVDSVSLAPSMSGPVISTKQDPLDERIPGLSDSPDSLLEEPKSTSFFEENGLPSCADEPWEPTCTGEENIHDLSYQFNTTPDFVVDSKEFQNNAIDEEIVVKSLPDAAEEGQKEAWKSCVVDNQTVTQSMGQASEIPNSFEVNIAESLAAEVCTEAPVARRNNGCSNHEPSSVDQLHAAKQPGHSQRNREDQCEGPDLETYIAPSVIEKVQCPAESLRCRNRGIQAKLIGRQGGEDNGIVVTTNHDATTNTDKPWIPRNASQELLSIHERDSMQVQVKTDGDAEAPRSSCNTITSYSVAVKLDEAEVTAHVSKTLHQGVDVSPVLVSVQVQTDTCAPSSGTAKSLSKFDSRESKMGVSRTQTVKSSQQPVFIADSATTNFKKDMSFPASQEELSMRRPISPSGSRGDESSTPIAPRFVIEGQTSTISKLETINQKANSAQAVRPLKQMKTNTGGGRGIPKAQSTYGREMAVVQKKNTRVPARKPVTTIQHGQSLKCQEKQTARRTTDFVGDAIAKSTADDLDHKSKQSCKVQNTSKPNMVDTLKVARRESLWSSMVDSGRPQQTSSCRISKSLNGATQDVQNIRENGQKGTKRMNGNVDACAAPKRPRPNEKLHASRVDRMKVSQYHVPGKNKKYVGLFASFKGQKRCILNSERPIGQAGVPVPQSSADNAQSKRPEEINGVNKVYCTPGIDLEATDSPAGFADGQKASRQKDSSSPLMRKFQKLGTESSGQTRLHVNHSDDLDNEPGKEEQMRAAQVLHEGGPLSLCECFSRSELETHFRAVVDEMGDSNKEKSALRGRVGEETCVVCKHQSLKYSPRVKNLRMAEEPWVQCDGCQGWVHQICSLFNSRLNSTGVRYICPSCQLYRMRNEADAPIARRPMNMNAKNLPTSLLSDFLESRLQAALAKEWKARCKLAGEEAPRVNQLTVREVFSQDRECRAGQQFRNAFKGKRAMKFPYRQRVIMLFQKIDGVDVLIFCMYTQEYGPEAPEPNKGWVYLAYVDSIKYFQPNQLAGNCVVPLRTLVYHEVLLGYMQFAQHYGYHSMFIWACPPGGKDNDYIMNCHPPSQKIPTEVRLRRWYLDLLEQAKMEGLVTEHANMSEVLQKKEGAFASALQIPYFDGDYWPEETEKLLEGIKSKSRARVCGLSKGNQVGNQDGWDEADQDLMSMLRASQSVSAWQNFLLARFKQRCSMCKEFLSEGPSWVYCPTETTPSQRRSSHSFTFRNDGHFVICPGCHKSETCCKEPQASKLPGFVNIHDFVQEYYKPAVLRGIPSDREISCNFLETRDLFLRVCQWNHYEFDSLRKAKHSSLMVLYHLMNPSVPVLPATCQVCHEHLEEESSWKCPTCLEVRFCENCYAAGLRHVHTLELVKSSRFPPNSCPQPSNGNDNITNRKKVQRTFELLVHAQDCDGVTCNILRCSKARSLLQHVQSDCEVADCVRCRRLSQFLQEHEKDCKGWSCPLKCCIQKRQKRKRSVPTIDQSQPEKRCRMDK